MIKRHTRSAMFMHWFNAACWLFLLATGLGLIRNDAMQLTDGVWSRWMHGLFGSGEALLAAHETVGLIWAGVFFIYGVLAFRKAVLPFVKEVLTISPARDLTWLLKKGIQMTLGAGVLRKKGIDPTLPDQGFYNVGQKLFAVPSLFGGILIGITGIILVISNVWLTHTGVIQWAIFIHFICVLLVFAGLLIHVYMASIAPGERPAFKSMFTGQVPEDYARHHHRTWYDEVKREEGL